MLRTVLSDPFETYAIYFPSFEIMLKSESGIMVDMAAHKLSWSCYVGISWEHAEISILL